MRTTDNFPLHVAIIPDGNRRWAKRHALTIRDGYARGVRKFREIMETAFRAHVPCVTFWAASRDNLIKRSSYEIKLLITLLKKELSDKILEEMMRNYGVRVRFLGRWAEIMRDKELEDVIARLEMKTKNFEGSKLTVLLGYDGKEEMREAIESISKNHEGEINDEVIRNSLWTGGLPPVDLVIRTGEEKPRFSHMSAGFMMWQTANSVFYATKTFWPEFSRREFTATIKNYSTRERRFGT